MSESQHSKRKWKKKTQNRREWKEKLTVFLAVTMMEAKRSWIRRLNSQKNPNSWSIYRAPKGYSKTWASCFPRKRVRPNFQIRVFLVVSKVKIMGKLSHIAQIVVSFHNYSKMQGDECESLISTLLIPL